jgi:hypothetical protein
VHRIVINAPIQAVWDELTRLDGKQRAMMDTRLDSTLEVGCPAVLPFAGRQARLHRRASARGEPF